MSAHIKLLYGGSYISEGDNSSPFSINDLNANNNEISSVYTLTLAMVQGFISNGTVTVSLSGTNYTMWRLSWDNSTWGSWGGSISTSTVITSSGIPLYIQARATTSDVRGTDDNVNLQVTTTIMSG